MARSNQKKKRRDKVTGLLLGAIGIVLMMLIGGGVWWVRSTKVHLDAATNCPQSGPRAVEVIMIDRSDPISEQQAQRIRQEVQRLKDLAQFGTRFDLYNFEGNQTNALLPEAQVCAPAKPTDANVVVENPERVRRIYVDKFSRPLDVAIDQLLVATTKPVSPILESLHAAAQTSFGALPDGIPCRLTLISDLIQHSVASSHFKSEPDFATLSRSAAWPSLRPKLHGASVQVLYLSRPSATRNGRHIQTRGHQAFWEQVIEAGGGAIEHIEPF